MPKLSYKYRIEPNKAQGAALDAMLRDFCGLYNAGLQQRLEAYQRRGVSVSYKMQADELKATRCAAPELARWSYTAEQQVLRKLDITFAAFFDRCKKGKKPGFPRFKASLRYHAATFRVGDGLTICKNGRLGFVGVDGDIKVRWHRQLPSKPKSAVLTRQNGKWYVVFHVEVAAVERASTDSVGIDLGLTSLIALSNGETVARPNWTGKASKETRRRQRALPGASAAARPGRSGLPPWRNTTRRPPTVGGISCTTFPAILLTGSAGSRLKTSTCSASPAGCWPST